MKNCSRVIIIGLCLILATSAFAARDVVVTRVGDVVPAVAGPAGVTTVDCEVGNANPAFWAITDWVWGAESYAFVFNPATQGCGCGAGFEVQTVHFLLQFAADDVPATFDASAGMEEAVWDATLGCWLPGPQVCLSNAYTVTINDPGIYDIALPVTCDCAFMDYEYTVSFNLLTEFTDGRPDAITDDIPLACTSWNDYGAGWEDLNSFGFPGGIKVWADVACCGQPVDTEKGTWGGVKSLFR